MKRLIAATILRDQINLLEKEYSNPKIIILGDFNDQPEDKSISEILEAKQVLNFNVSSQLYDLSYEWMGEKLGTINYQSIWSVFDQVIVSGSLLKTEFGFYTKKDAVVLIDLPFLLERDKRYGGMKPKRSYIGFTYNGGFSDHLPVLLKLEIKD